MIEGSGFPGLRSLEEGEEVLLVDGVGLMFREGPEILLHGPIIG